MSWDSFMEQVSPGRAQNKALKGYSEMYGAKLKELDGFFEDEYNRDYMDTSMGKVFSNLISQKMQEQGQQNDQKAAITGGTTESKIAGSSAIQQNMGDAFSQLSQHATTYRDRLKNNHFSQMMQLNQAKAGMEMQRLNNISDRNKNTVENFQQQMENAQEGIKLVAGM